MQNIDCYTLQAFFEENIDFFIGRRHIAILVDGYSIISRKIEGEFIDYKKIIFLRFFGCNYGNFLYYRF